MTTTSFPKLPGDRQFQKWLIKEKHTPDCRVWNCDQVVADATKNLLFVTRFSRLAGNWLSVPCQCFEVMLKKLIFCISRLMFRRNLPFAFSKFLISIEKNYSKNEGEIPVKMASKTTTHCNQHLAPTMFSVVSSASHTVGALLEHVSSWHSTNFHECFTGRFTFRRTRKCKDVHSRSRSHQKLICSSYHHFNAFLHGSKTFAIIHKY